MGMASGTHGYATSLLAQSSGWDQPVWHGPLTSFHPFSCVFWLAVFLFCFSALLCFFVGARPVVVVLFVRLSKSVPSAGVGVAICMYVHTAS